MSQPLAAEVVELPVGEWVPPDDQSQSGHLGYLLAKGLIVREIRVAGAWGVELLDRGDLLVPWIEDAASFVEAEWRVIEPARLVVLARVARGGDRRGLTEDLVSRAMRRSRSMAVHAAIAATRRVEERLLLLLWHVAERRGRRGPNGVEVSLPVTHETLAHLVGARRPSVTTALRDLEHRGAISRRAPGRWFLHGEAPSAREGVLGSEEPLP
jgi:CRP/FNR family transcriptional regulator, cyclic AMP receptor protein